MNPSTALRLSALLGFLGVALGAAGAHGLQPLLSRTGHADEWKTAVLYHLVHAVALLVLASREVVPKIAWWSICSGVVLFSGSLYIYAATGIVWLAHVTPFGGLCLLAGWFTLVLKPR